MLSPCLPLCAARKEFWTSKDPASWTPVEKELLLGHSPWAQESFIRMEVEKRLKTPVGYGNNGRLGGGEIPSGKPRSQPGGERSMPLYEEIPPVPSTNPGDPVKFRALARWETAEPVRLAGGPALPELTGLLYVIRLFGLPLMPPPKPKRGQETVTNPNEGLLQLVQKGTRLDRMNKPPIPCARLLTGSGAMANQVLLLFPREPDPITLAERSVTLDCWFDPFHLSVKFLLKDMLYKGELAL